MPDPIRATTIVSDFRGLRVLMLTPSYAPRSGGVERHVRRVVRELALHGLEVRIATPRWEDDWPEREVVGGIEVFRLSRDGGEGRRQLIPLVSWAEILHTHDAYPFLKYYLPWRLWNAGPPAFVTFHGYEGYPIPLEAKLLRRFVLWLTRGSICAGAFIPRWYGFRCTHVTHGGVDPPPKRPPLGEGAVFVGRLERDTGFRTYLQVLKRLRDEFGVTLQLEVCGDGSLRTEGEEYARANGLDVTFWGMVPDVMPYLARARFAFVDGLLAILEAMASGAVVLSAYDNPLKEDYLRLFPGAGFMTIAGSPEELAARLARLQGAPELAEQIAAQAYAFARTQSWARVTDFYLDLYRIARPATHARALPQPAAPAAPPALAEGPT
jgi:glycosyltransferase involved in cell wall biosynthesis